MRENNKRKCALGGGRGLVRKELSKGMINVPKLRQQRIEAVQRS